jgi:hypothetical protein
MMGGLDRTELAREAATLLMLMTVGWLAGRKWRTRLAYWLIAFGVWDIFYYVFLKTLTGWPQSLFSWDVLFLLPLPWWGPVFAPVSVALLMILWGTLMCGEEEPGEGLCLNRKVYGLNLAGIGLALYVFMADSIRVLGEGREILRTLLPTKFNWPLFGVAWLLMAVPVADAAWQAWRRRGTRLVAPRTTSQLNGRQGQLS